MAIVIATASAMAAKPTKDSAPSVQTLTLNEAIQRTLQYNRTLHNAGLAINDSQLNLDASKADFDVKITPLSNIGFSSGQQTSSADWQLGSEIRKKLASGIVVSLRPATIQSGEFHTSEIGMRLNVPLFRGFGEDVALDQVYGSSFSLESAYRSLHTSRVNAVIDTITNVYDIVKTEKLLKLYQQQIRLLEHHVSTLRVKEKAGLITVMDIYRAELSLKDAQQNNNVATTQLRDLKNRLKNRVVLPLDREITVTAPMDYSPVAMSADEAITIGLKNRVEIAQARANVKEASRHEAIARNNTLPELIVSSEYAKQATSDSFANSMGLEDDVFRVQLVSNTDFSRVAEKTAWEKSKLDVRRKQLDFEGTKENISEEIRNILNSLEKTTERISLRREQIHQAGGKKELAAIKFKYGEANNFDLIEAQNELQTANVNLLSEEIQYIVDTYRFQAALGTLLSYEF